MSRIQRLAIFLELYKFSLGSLKYILDNMRPPLEKRGNAEAIKKLDEAEEKQQDAMLKRHRWNQIKQQDSLKREGTVQLDGRIDETLSSLVQAAEAFTNLPDEDKQCQCAEEFLDDLFPEGVFPVTSQTFDDQHANVAALVQEMRVEYTDHLEEMNLMGMVDQLEALNQEFGEKLEPAGDIEYDQVQAAYVEAEDAFHRLFVNVLDEYSDDLEALNEVLAPVVEQTKRTRRHLQRRGTIPEVDPETGEPVEESDGQPPVPDDQQGPSGDSSPDGGSSSGDSSDGNNETDVSDGEGGNSGN